MKKHLFILLIVFACKEDEPEPIGCVIAINPGGTHRGKLACATEAQFNIAVKNGGKLGAGTNTLHPDWTFYSEHQWMKCSECK